MEPGCYYARRRPSGPRARKPRPWVLVVTDGDSAKAVSFDKCHAFPFGVDQWEFGPRIPDYVPEKGGERE